MQRSGAETQRRAGCAPPPPGSPSARGPSSQGSALGTPGFCEGWGAPVYRRFKQVNGRLKRVQCLGRVPRTTPPGSHYFKVGSRRAARCHPRGCGHGPGSRNSARTYWVRRGTGWADGGVEGLSAELGGRAAWRRHAGPPHGMMRPQGPCKDHGGRCTAGGAGQPSRELCLVSCLLRELRLSRRPCGLGRKWSHGP